jgi:hypothetical protein
MAAAGTIFMGDGLGTREIFTPFQSDHFKPGMLHY